MKEQAHIRDILALPLTLVGMICMFATLPLFALATTIGGKWTAEIVLKMYGHNIKSTN